jgi:hypothetical protein
MDKRMSSDEKLPDLFAGFGKKKAKREVNNMNGKGRSRKETPLQ